MLSSLDLSVILLFFAIIMCQLQTEEMAIGKTEHWKEAWGREVLIQQGEKRGRKDRWTGRVHSIEGAVGGRGGEA